MTKEEILEQQDHDTEMLDYGECLKAMDVYAKQQCITLLKRLSLMGYFDCRISCDTPKDLEYIYKEFCHDCHYYGIHRGMPNYIHGRYSKKIRG